MPQLNIFKYFKCFKKCNGNKNKLNKKVKFNNNITIILISDPITQTTTKQINETTTKQITESTIQTSIEKNNNYNCVLCFFV
jgi:hypothetical protein